MRSIEIERVQKHLQKTFGNAKIRIAPTKAKDGAEVYVGEEFIATLHRDVDEGEVSYVLTMSILDTDLTP